MIIDHVIEVDYSCEQMFKLIADYERYPEFIKVCSGSKTTSKSDNSVLAELQMSFSGLKQKFSTLTTFYPHEKITMELVEGPFKKLHGYWSFTPKSEQSCEVAVYMDYEMSSILEMMLGSKFKKSIYSMVDSFVEQAAKIYK